MERMILFACEIFHLLAALYGVYFGVVSLCVLLRARALPVSDRHLHFAVLVPARNEETCITGIVESIQKQAYPPELVDIYVIPNNCTDQTAVVAAQAGASILTVSPSVRSKGQALQEAFAQLLAENEHDAFCVFDADNELSPTFLAEMNKALAGARVAKSRIYAKNPHESWVCGCYEIFFCNANLLLNRARQKIGWSARLIGTGFAVRRDLLIELGGWHTETLTEDAEFYAKLAARGEHIEFVPDAITYDEEPLSFWQSMTQRRRWMSGIMEVAGKQMPALWRGVFRDGGWRAADCLLQLSFAWIQAWILPVLLLEICADPEAALLELPCNLAVFCGTVWLTGIASLLFEKRLRKKSVPSLLLYPLFIFSFLPLQTLSLLIPNKTWKPIVHTGVRLKHPTSGKT